MSEGWIKIHRKIWDSDLWKQRRKFSRVEAWIDLLLLARHDEEPEKVLIKNVIVPCGRGEIIRSLDTLAGRWNWSRDGVRRFLILLQKLEQITVKNETVTTRITITNYESHQAANPHKQRDERDASENRNGVDAERAQKPQQLNGYQKGTYGTDCDGVATELRRSCDGVATELRTNKNVKNGKNEKNVRSIGKHQLPKSFPSDRVMDYARETLDASMDVSTELQKFKNYSEANGKKYKNWDAAFRNWILNANRYAKERQPKESEFNFDPMPR